MSEVQAAAPEPVAPEVPTNPFEYIAKKYPNAPSEAVVLGWKQQVPGARVRFFEHPDGKRSVYLRGISPLELATIQAEVSKLAPDKQVWEVQAAVSAKCTLWCSFTTTSKITVADLQAAGAGLAPTLYTVVCDVSDFVDPAVIDNFVLDF